MEYETTKQKNMNITEYLLNNNISSAISNKNPYNYLIYLVAF